MSHGKPPATKEQGLQMSLNLVNKRAKELSAKVTAQQARIQELEEVILDVRLVCENEDIAIWPRLDRALARLDGEG